MNKISVTVCCVLATMHLYTTAMDEYNKSLATSAQISRIFNDPNNELEHTTISANKKLFMQLLSQAEQKSAETDFKSLHELITDDKTVTVPSKHMNLMHDLFAAIPWNGEIDKLYNKDAHPILLNGTTTALIIGGGKTKSIPVKTAIILSAFAFTEDPKE